MSDTDPTLADLLHDIQAGREDALIALHARYARLVYAVAYRVLNDSMAAEEVTQDTFMRLWHKSEMYDAAKGSFVTWLLTITRRLAIDTFRKQQRDALTDPVFLEAHAERWEAVLGSEPGSDLRGSLVSVLAQLPAEQRQVIELAYFHGLTHSQIAARLDEPLGTVKTRLRLGMHKLRAEWFAEPVTNPNTGKNT